MFRSKATLSRFRSGTVMRHTWWYDVYNIRSPRVLCSRVWRARHKYRIISSGTSPPFCFQVPPSARAHSIFLPAGAGDEQCHHDASLSGVNADSGAINAHVSSRVSVRATTKAISTPPCGQMEGGRVGAVRREATSARSIFFTYFGRVGGQSFDVFLPWGERSPAVLIARRSALDSWQ